MLIHSEISSKNLVDFFYIELFGDFEADLKFFMVVNQSKGIREAIELLDLELFSNMDAIFFQILEKFKAIMNSCQKIGSRCLDIREW